MSKCGYLKVFQRVPLTSRYPESTVYHSPYYLLLKAIYKRPIAVSLWMKKYNTTRFCRLGKQTKKLLTRAFPPTRGVVVRTRDYILGFSSRLSLSPCTLDQNFASISMLFDHQSISMPQNSVIRSNSATLTTAGRLFIGLLGHMIRYLETLSFRRP